MFAVKMLRHGSIWLTVATLGGYLGSVGWMLDLMSHFRVQYAGLLALCVASFAMLRAFRSASLAAIPLIVNVVLILPLYHESDPRPVSAGSFTAIQFNASMNNPRLDEAIQWVRDRDVDVVVVHEVNPRMLLRWTAGLPGHTCLAESARDDPFGIALFVRTEGADLTARSSSVHHERGQLVPCVAAELLFQGRSLRLLGFRAPPPISSGMTRLRDGAIANAASWVLAAETPVAVIGDFNATRWSHPIREFLSMTQLSDAEDGRGFHPTWPVGSPIQIVIDRTFSSPELVVTSRELGPDLGSDHRPQEVSFAWRDPP